MDSLWIELALVAFAVVTNGFFSGSEIALISARVSGLAALRQAGVRGADTALRLKESPEAFLATIQIAITLVGAVASAVGGAAAAERLSPWLAGLPLPGAATWAEPVALVLVILVITYVSLVVGELTPKTLALRNAERLAVTVAPLIVWLSRASASVVRVLTASTDVVLALLLQGRARESPFVSEEEVKYLIREGAARGVFEKVEEELVHNVFEFADTTAREVMVPRVNVTGIDVETPADRLLPRLAEIGHSRIPVYRDSIEYTVGVLTIRDVVARLARGEPLVLPTLLRPPLFIPETARISLVLREFQRRREYLALVVDEYGSVVGLLTLQDVVEQIVGDIREPGEGAGSHISRLPDGSFVLDGATPVRDLRDTLAIPVPESPDYTTAAGYVITTLGSIPGPGASIEHGGWRWTVVDMEGPRIAKVKVQRRDA